MLKQTIFAVLAATFSVGAFAGTKCIDHPQNEKIPAAKFQEQLKQQGYQIKKFKETSANCDEIYGHNKDGQKVEIYFDTKTGQVVKSKMDD